MCHFGLGHKPEMLISLQISLRTFIEILLSEQCASFKKLPVHNNVKIYITQITANQNICNI